MGQCPTGVLPVFVFGNGHIVADGHAGRSQHVVHAASRVGLIHHHFGRHQERSARTDELLEPLDALRRPGFDRIEQYDHIGAGQVGLGQLR
jgi:hypothetical protein